MLKLPTWFRSQVVPVLAHAYIRFLWRTGTYTWRGREVLEEARRNEGRYILAFWHSRWVLMPYSYPGGKLAVLLSQHRDAEILAGVLGRFGLETARGSSTRGGVEGLRAIVRKCRAGYDVGIAPDGPRGPRRRVQAGVIAMARLTGLPIVPVTYSAAPGRRLRSWDRTLVPRPFASGVFWYGTLLRVPRDADAQEEERLRCLLEAELDRITDQADAETGMGAEAPEAGPAAA